MTKYPIKHTMEFGRKTECNSECGMRMKYPISCGQHNCEYLNVSVTFELVKACPECGGLGYDDDLRDKDYLDSESCLNCSDNGLPAGKVPRYWTPEEATEHIKKETGIEWEWPLVQPVYVLKYRREWGLLRLGDIPERMNVAYVLAFPGQPAPPADYRPDEN